MNRVLLSVVIVALGTVAGFASAQGGRKADIASLQGTWVLDAVEWLGEKTEQNLNELDVRQMKLQWLPEKRHVQVDLKKYRTTLTFNKSRYIHQYRVSDLGGRQKIVREKGSYQLDVSKTPRVLQMKQASIVYQFDDDIGDQLSSGLANKKPRHCIYSVKADILRCAWREAGDRQTLPTSFSTERDESVYVFIYKRERK